MTSDNSDMGDSSPDNEPNSSEARSVLDGLGGNNAAMVGLSAFIIVVAGAVAYVNALNIAFHFPDGQHIVENAALHDPATITESLTHPDLTLTSAVTLSLNWLMSGGEARSFHLWNVVLHLLVAIFVFLVARRVVGRDVPDVVPMIAGLLFAVHPLGTQTVNALLSRSFLLSALFVLVSVWSFLKASDSDAVRVRYWFVSLLAFLLAWSCGPWAWGIPVLVLMADLTVHSSLRRAYYAVHGSYWAALIFVAVYQSAALGSTGSSAGLTDAYALASSTLTLTGVSAVWPASLSASHASPGGGIIWGIALGVSLAVFYRFRRAGFALLWATVFAGAYSYWGESANLREELAYLPLAGLSMLVAVLVASVKVGPPRLMAGATCAIVALALMATTSARNQTWRSEAALWLDANENCVECVEPLERLGVLNEVEGTRMLREIQPSMAASDAADAEREEAMSYIRDAGDFYAMAINLDRGSSVLWRRLGYMQQLNEQVDEAQQSYMQALALDPTDRDAMLGLADSADMGSDTRRALMYFDAAYRAGQLPAVASVRYIPLLAEVGRYAAAQRLMEAYPVIVQQGNLQGASGRVRSKTESLAAVRSQIRQAVAQRKPAGAIVALSAREYYFDGNYLMASYQLEEAARSGQFSIDDWVVLGMARAQTGNLETFLEEWPGAFPAHDDADSWYRLAGGLASEANWDDALAVLKQREAKTDGDDIPELVLGDMASNNNDIQAAVRYYQMAMDAYPEAYEPWLGMARMAANANRNNQNRAVVVSNFLEGATERGAPEEALDEIRAIIGITRPDPADSALPERTIIR